MPYTFLPLVASLVMLYALTWFLAREKVISLLTHRRIWNLLLLASFLVTAFLGLLLVVRLNWGWSPWLPFDMLYWHVESGIVMAVISIFHVAWHWRYFALMVRRKQKQ